MKTQNKLIGAGLVSAIAASLCCITPVLALVAGASGLASTFSWLEPARPYLFGLTVLVLGFAWYQKLKPKKKIDCDCETDEKPKFIQTKTFLGIVTVFAGSMLAFPYYAQIFYSNNKKQVIVVDKSNHQKKDASSTVEKSGFSDMGLTANQKKKDISKIDSGKQGNTNNSGTKDEKQTIFVKKSNIHRVEFTINGMSCVDCERPINYKINNLPGIITSDVSYKNGNAIVTFDISKTTSIEIEKAINSTGYTVTKKKKK